MTSLPTKEVQPERFARERNILMYTPQKPAKSKTKHPPQMRISRVCIAEVVDQQLIAIGGILQPLTQRLLGKLIPDFQVLNEKFRKSCEEVL
ncbi:hypothetical protein RFF05_12555 [Bengtsoniella intestinalis]|uniref:hypothetical protein n=1 Tax=Bengtsoniella intestinalis TaxID=3073143 RepID=UPI00391FAB6C